MIMPTRCWWMGKVFSPWSSVGVIVQILTSMKKVLIMNVTYATNNELGFDYLREI